MAGWRLYWSVVIAACLLKEDCQVCSMYACTRQHGGHHLHFTPPADRSTVNESNRAILSFKMKQVSLPATTIVGVFLCCFVIGVHFMLRCLWLWWHFGIAVFNWISAVWSGYLLSESILLLGLCEVTLCFCGTQIERSVVRLYKSNSFSFKEEVLFCFQWQTLCANIPTYVLSVSDY